VREQAGELSGLLGAAGAYGRLCERRLLEPAPGHPLPVTADHLGHFAGVGRDGEGEEGEEGGEGEADSCGQGAGRRGVPWGDAEVAHLESLLVRFPVLGPPHGSLPQMLFWNKVSSCLAAGADGSGLRAARTASAVYQRAKKLQRVARRK
jgi:hypothetical protein